MNFTEKRSYDVMFNDSTFMRRHRGSSPPDPERERILEEWMKNCRSVDQHPYDMSEIEMLKQCTLPMPDFSDKNPEKKEAPVEPDNGPQDEDRIVTVNKDKAGLPG